MLSTQEGCDTTYSTAISLCIDPVLANDMQSVSSLLGTGTERT